MADSRIRSLSVSVNPHETKKETLTAQFETALMMQKANRRGHGQAWNDAICSLHGYYLLTPQAIALSSDVAKEKSIDTALRIAVLLGFSRIFSIILESGRINLLKEKIIWQDIYLSNQYGTNNTVLEGFVKDIMQHLMYAHPYFIKIKNEFESHIKKHIPLLLPELTSLVKEYYLPHNLSYLPRDDRINQLLLDGIKVFSELETTIPFSIRIWDQFEVRNSTDVRILDAKITRYESKKSGSSYSRLGIAFSLSGITRIPSLTLMAKVTHNLISSIGTQACIEEQLKRKNFASACLALMLQPHLHYFSQFEKYIHDRDEWRLSLLDWVFKIYDSAKAMNLPFDSHHLTIKFLEYLVNHGLDLEKDQAYWFIQQLLLKNDPLRIRSFQVVTSLSNVDSKQIIAQLLDGDFHRIKKESDFRSFLDKLASYNNEEVLQYFFQEYNFALAVIEKGYRFFEILLAKGPINLMVINQSLKNTCQAMQWSPRKGQIISAIEKFLASNSSPEKQLGAIFAEHRDHQSKIDSSLQQNSLFTNAITASPTIPHKQYSQEEVKYATTALSKLSRAEDRLSLEGIAIIRRAEEVIIPFGSRDDIKTTFQIALDLGLHSLISTILQPRKRDSFTMTGVGVSVFSNILGRVVKNTALEESVQSEQYERAKKIIHHLVHAHPWFIKMKHAFETDIQPYLSSQLSAVLIPIIKEYYLPQHLADLPRNSAMDQMLYYSEILNSEAISIYTKSLIGDHFDIFIPGYEYGNFNQLRTFMDQFSTLEEKAQAELKTSHPYLASTIANIPNHAYFVSSIGKDLYCLALKNSISRLIQFGSIGTKAYIEMQLEQGNFIYAYHALMVEPDISYFSCFNKYAHLDVFQKSLYLWLTEYCTLSFNSNSLSREAYYTAKLMFYLFDPNFYLKESMSDEQYERIQFIFMEAFEAAGVDKPLRDEILNIARFDIKGFMVEQLISDFEKTTNDLPAFQSFLNRLICFNTADILQRFFNQTDFLQVVINRGDDFFSMLRRQEYINEMLITPSLLEEYKKEKDSSHDQSRTIVITSSTALLFSRPPSPISSVTVVTTSSSSSLADAKRESLPNNGP